jgi:hypothetical protein
LEAFCQREGAWAIPRDHDLMTKLAHESNQGLSELFVIVDDQHPSLVQCLDRCRWRWHRTRRSWSARSIRNHDGQPGDELTPFRETAADGLDATAMQLYHSTRDAEPQAQATTAAGERATLPLERLEYVLQVLAGDTDAVVTHAQHASPSRCSSASVIWPPGSVYFAAFSSRLVMT